jgi:hypothetical protein
MKTKKTQTSLSTREGGSQTRLVLTWKRASDFHWPWEQTASFKRIHSRMKVTYANYLPDRALIAARSAWAGRQWILSRKRSELFPIVLKCCLEHLTQAEQDEKGKLAQVSLTLPRRTEKRKSVRRPVRSSKYLKQRRNNSKKTKGTRAASKI